MARDPMKTTSRWRLAARAAIEAVIAGLPAGLGASDMAEVKRRLKAAYPFGERQMEPYKAWLKEQRLALERLTPVKAVDPVKAPEMKAPEIRFELMPGRWPPWVMLVCEWCRSGRHSNSRGCMMCAASYDCLDALVNTPSWRTWRLAMQADARAALPFADWLDDHGHSEIAALVRAAGFEKLAVLAGQPATEGRP